MFCGRGSESGISHIQKRSVCEESTLPSHTPTLPLIFHFSLGAFLTQQQLSSSSGSQAHIFLGVFLAVPLHFRNQLYLMTKYKFHASFVLPHFKASIPSCSFIPSSVLIFPDVSYLPNQTALMRIMRTSNSLSKLMKGRH